MERFVARGALLHLRVHDHLRLERDDRPSGVLMFFMALFDALLERLDLL